MGNLPRVYITGFAALASTGDCADAIWQQLLEGQSGIGPIEQWDVADWPCRLGGELKDFAPAKRLPDRKLLKVISRQDAMGIIAAVDAIKHSGLDAYQSTLDCKDAFNETTGVYVGSPGNKYYQQYDFLPLMAKTHGDMKAFAQHLFDEVHPMWLLRILPNNVLAYTGITYGFKGPNHNIANHAVGGGQAVLEAFKAIQSGQAERAVVVAYDVGTEPQALYYYDKLGVLSEQHLLPFDRAHDGTLLAEGACALVLESETSVKQRGATAYAELVGGCANTEAAGLFSIESEGDTLAALLEQTLEKANITPEDLAFVAAHANGNPKSDISEAKALARLFNHHPVPVTGFKWSMGHTLCTSGVLDTMLSAMALHHKVIPGIANLKDVASDCAHLNVSAEARPLRAGAYALVMNRGFASMNVCLALKACDAND